LIFNLSLSSGIFPNSWKESHVVPIFKDGDKRNVSNYRGISILSAIPKLFEKLVVDKITPSVQSSISDNQHGFVKGRSAVTNLTQFSNFVINELEDGRQVVGVYTDFSKAFDRVNHGLLKINLSRKFRPPALCWMSSYATGRTQRVKLKDYLSDEIHCHSGVPQGSHLGPLFFIIDINDVFQIFNDSRVQAFGYADDLKIFMTIKSLNDCLILQRNLDNLMNWCVVNKFDLNASKCKTITFGRGANTIDFQYKIGDNVLENVDKMKDLGVWMDERMTFVHHIELMVAKSSRMLGFIKRIAREFHDPCTLKTLYVALVRQNLEYASCVWSPYRRVHSERIEKIQHNFVRYALRKLGWTQQPLPSYENRSALLGLEILSDRRKVCAALFIRDLLCERIESAYLLALLSFEDTPYSRRRNAKLMVFFHRYDYGKFEPLNKAIMIFNEYCGEFAFQSETSREVFRGRFRRWLFSERMRPGPRPLQH
jgi:Reverse transcriptase (RNA-dependent DNA polymerase)